MFNNLINNEVEVIVSSRAETLLEYCGTLCEEDDNYIKLKNVSINFAILNFQKSIFGSGLNSYKQNISEIIINKQFIISCNRK